MSPGPSGPRGPRHGELHGFHACGQEGQRAGGRASDARAHGAGWEERCAALGGRDIMLSCFIMYYIISYCIKIL